MQKIKLIFILGLFTFGCSGLWHSRKPLDPDAKPEVIFALVRQNTAKVQTFTGRGMLSVSSMQGSFRASITVRIIRPDSLWFKIEGPLGLDLASGRISQDKMEILVVRENTLYTGSILKMQELSLLPVPIDLCDFAAVLQGFYKPVSQTSDSLTSVSLDNRIYRFDFKSGNVSYINADLQSVILHEKTGEGGELQLKFETGEYKKIKKVFMPRLVKLTGYQPKQRLTILYESLQINKKFKPGWFEFKIPEGVNFVHI